MSVALSAVLCERPFTEVTRNKSKCKLSSNVISKLFNRTRCRVGNLQYLFQQQQFLSLLNRACLLLQFLNLLTSDARRARVCQLLCRFQDTSIVTHLALILRDLPVHLGTLLLLVNLRTNTSRLVMSTAAILLVRDHRGSLVWPTPMGKSSCPSTRDQSRGKITLSLIASQ